MQVSVPFIEYWAKGAAAAARCRQLHTAFSELFCNEEQTIYWGAYQGSGAGLYQTAVSLPPEGQPRFSCTCPSRKKPCKHVLGLLWAALLTPGSFERQAPPEQLQPKPPRNLRKENAARARQSLRLRQDGLVITQALMRDMVFQGMSDTPLVLAEWKTLARSLTDYRLPGVSARLLELLTGYTYAITPQTLFRFASLYYEVKQSSLYIQQRLDNPQAPVVPALESFMGKIWRLGDLETHGQTRPDACLLQLTFGRLDEPAARRTLDRGYWADLTTGDIFETQTITPYTAAAQIEPEDSCFSLIYPQPLYIYPDGLRVRWNACRPADPDADTYKALLACAKPSLKDILPAVTGRLFAMPESPPVYLLRFQDIGRQSERLVLRDFDGLALPLTEGQVPYSESLPALYAPQYRAVLVRFVPELATGELQGELLCLVSERGSYPLSY